MRWPWSKRTGDQAPKAGNGRHRLEGVRVLRKPHDGALDLIAELDHLGFPLCAVDRNGRRYTTAVAATERDWWWGATILGPGVLATLKAEGLLPLREVDPRTDEVIL